MAIIATTHKSCPECHTRILVDSQSCPCGWQQGAAPQAPGDATRCAHVDRDTGEECRRPGVVSIAGGPWLCRQHDGRMKPQGRSLAVREWHERWARYVEAHPGHRMPSFGDAGADVRNPQQSAHNVAA